MFDEIKQFKPVHEQFADQNYPIGEIQEYLPGKDDTTTLNRFTSAEKKSVEANFDDMYKNLRRAAESHRQTRKYIKSWLEP
jgi:methionyl aminopeptidase